MTTMNDQKLRRIIRRAIQESKTKKTVLKEYELSGDAGELYNVFVAPFTDVVKSGVLASQDILNSLNLVFKTMITLSPKKMEQYAKEYDARKDKINAKWEPLMKSADIALESGDAALLMAVTNPSMFLGGKLGKGLAKTPKNVANYLNDTGFTVPLSGLLGASVPDLGVQKEKGLIGKGIDVAKDILGLFYIESYLNSNLPLILEEKDEEEEKGGLTKQNFEKELEKHFKETGLDEAFDEAFEEIFEARKELVDNIMSEAEGQLEFLTGFAAAQSLEEMMQVLDAAPDLEGIDQVRSSLEEVAKELSEKAQSLMNDDDFKKELEKESEKEDVDELSDEEIKKGAEAAAQKAADEAIAKIKGQFEKEINEGIPEFKKEVIEKILEGAPEEGSKEFSAIAKTPQGKKYLNMLKDARDKIEEYQVESTSTQQS